MREHESTLLSASNESIQEEIDHIEQTFSTPEEEEGQKIVEAAEAARRINLAATALQSIHFPNQERPFAHLKVTPEND